MEICPIYVEMNNDSIDGMIINKNRMVMEVNSILER